MPLHVHGTAQRSAALTRHRVPLAALLRQQLLHAGVGLLDSTQRAQRVGPRHVLVHQLPVAPPQLHVLQPLPAGRHGRPQGGAYVGGERDAWRPMHSPQPGSAATGHSGSCCSHIYNGCPQQKRKKLYTRTGWPPRRRRPCRPGARSGRPGRRAGRARGPATCARAPAARSPPGLLGRSPAQSACHSCRRRGGRQGWGFRPVACGSSS